MLCKLALEDGSIFSGRAFGATGTQSGEVVFNTAHTGYQEIFTDPSYCGQIVTMTFPLIGNYGVNPEDFESARPHLAGFVVKEACAQPSNYRATQTLSDFLRQHNIIGLAGVDTRALTRRIRVRGALRGVISTDLLDELRLVQMARAAGSMVGANLVDCVKPAGVREWFEPLWTPETIVKSAEKPRCHVVAIDCGIKSNILRYLSETGCRVTVAPADASAEQLRELRPDALLVGNGPGDPAAVTRTIDTLKDVLGEVPVFGICLGHQMIALALGASTYKLKFGHHGANQPVLNRRSGKVEITSQNHGFAVDEKSLQRVGGVVTHVNLNDDSVEGYIHPDKQVMCVQFHPEAAPGPHDAGYLFRRFVDAVAAKQPVGLELLDD
jgi:carbamoyl-phosphate synthase small subunit